MEITTLDFAFGRKNTEKYTCLLTEVKDALDRNDYKKASKLQIKTQEKISTLLDMYETYKKNIF